MNDKPKTPGAMVLADQLRELQKQLTFASDRDLIRTAIEALSTEQPPALGGEPEVIGYFYKGDHMGDQFDKRCLKHYYRKAGSAEHEYIQPVELIDRAHVAPLLAEIERLKDEAHQDGMLRVRYGKEMDALKVRIAELEAQQSEPVTLHPRGEAFYRNRAAD